MSNLRVIKLIEPEICAECRFSSIVLVSTESIVKVRMIRCTRLDCDNWDMQNSEQVTEIDEEK